MDLHSHIKQIFGKDMFKHLDRDELQEERIKVEKRVERISDEMQVIQDKMQKLMMESKGKPKPMKLLNISKIKTLRLESNTKQQEAERYIHQMQLILLVEALREHQTDKKKNKFIDKLLKSDVDHLMNVLFDEDVKKAIEEGKIDDVRDKLKEVFGKEELPTDAETVELMRAIEDLEEVDEETALKMAGEKAKRIAETPTKKTASEME
ncbi:MAG: hypothetical protein FJY76_02410 [Candidatus Aenigmarchaeota archaeon]|nr:hypothetical protein [Candidatus Aenigmarchaeota archaeon]